MHFADRKKNHISVEAFAKEFPEAYANAVEKQGQ
jgi:hypothetical protein